jgi:hypothetical protein
MSPLQTQGEQMDHFEEILNSWGRMAQESQEEVSRVSHWNEELMNAIAEMKHSFRSLRGQLFEMPQAIATQAIYAECGSDEGTIEYECHQSVQAHFRESQSLGYARTEKADEPGSSPSI